MGAFDKKAMTGGNSIATLGAYKGPHTEPSHMSDQAKQMTDDEAAEFAEQVFDVARKGDAAMLAAAQAVEHYEISRYGTLIAWAAELDHADIGKMLQPTLDEEKATDLKLTQLAEARLNRKAA
jgi:ferritin-like metal-binding protein YciE